MSNGSGTECPTGNCGYGIYQGEGPCDGGNSSCVNARLVTEGPTTSAFTEEIKAASADLNAIFDGLHPDPEGRGRGLSLLRNPRGIVVGWLRHDKTMEPDPKYVRAEDPRVIQELRINEIGADGDPCALGTCGWEEIDGEVYCTQSPVATCWRAVFVQADDSPYHPVDVDRKTIEIKARLAVLEKEANGRKLALLLTDQGPKLSWVHHQSPAQMA